MPKTKPREPWDAERAPMFHRIHYRKDAAALRAMLLGLTEPPPGTRVVAHSFPSEWRGLLPKNTLKPRAKGTRAVVRSVRAGVATVELLDGETARVPVMYLRPLKLTVGDFPLKVAIQCTTVDGDDVDVTQLRPTLKVLEAARAEFDGFFKRKSRPKTKKVTRDNIEIGYIVIHLRDKEGDRLGVVTDADAYLHNSGGAAVVRFSEDEEDRIPYTQLEVVRGEFYVEPPVQNTGYEFIVTPTGDLCVGCQYITIHQVRDLVAFGDRLTDFKKHL